MAEPEHDEVVAHACSDVGVPARGRGGGKGARRGVPRTLTWMEGGMLRWASWAVGGWLYGTYCQLRCGMEWLWPVS